MDRVVTKLEIKSVSEDRREVEGWASTGGVDRAGDRLDPFGCQFDLEARPVPFLMDHDASFSVGEIIAAEVSAKGVYFRAKIKKIDEPGKAKEQTDYAWHCLKHGLRKSLSVGFIPLEAEPLPGGGYFFRSWDWLELSAVSTPCNAEALVTSVKRAPGVPERRANHSQADHRKGVVRLTESDRRRGKMMADAKRFNNALRKAGVPLPVVRITGDDIVEMELAALAEKRKAKKLRDKLRGTVKVPRA